jgi:hypothetical protein
MFVFRQFVCIIALQFVLFSNNGFGQVPSASTQERAVAGGLIQYMSKHLTLYTDIRDNAAIAELPGVFDQAVPQWAAFLDVPPQRLANWHMTGFIMLDAKRFSRVGLIPNDLPEFLHAFQLGDQFWVHEQPSDYYRRHLVLHEGTHGVMTQLFGGAGPPWYMEGTAELLGTHQWDGKTLKLAVIPGSKEEFAYWGRLKIIRRAQQVRDVPAIIDIVQYGRQAHLQVEPYAWCWALAVFLDREPATQRSFRRFAKTGADADFSAKFRLEHSSRWRVLEQQWQGFVADMEYGFSPNRTIPKLHKPRAWNDQVQVAITADHAWQATGIQLVAGQKYRIQSTSRYQIGDTPSPWWCEPQGVTIDYYRHRPLGMLLAALVNDTTVAKPSDKQQRSDEEFSFLQPLAVGRQIEFRANRSGTLFLKVNESAAMLDDNDGTLTVTITKVR